MLPILSGTVLVLFVNGVPTIWWKSGGRVVATCVVGFVRQWYSGFAVGVHLLVATNVSLGGTLQ